MFEFRVQHAETITSLAPLCLVDLCGELLGVGTGGREQELIERVAGDRSSTGGRKIVGFGGDRTKYTATQMAWVGTRNNKVQEPAWWVDEDFDKYKIKRNPAKKKTLPLVNHNVK